MIKPILIEDNNLKNNNLKNNSLKNNNLKNRQEVGLQTAYKFKAMG